MHATSRRRGSSSWPIVALTAALLGLAACGQGASPSPGGASQTSSPPEKETDDAGSGGGVPSSFWENPIVDGVIASDLDAEALVFQPHVPRDLGAPLKQVVTEVDTIPDPYREVGWVYEHPTYGLFVIRERLVNKAAAEAEMEELAAHPTPGCEPSPVSETELGEGAYAEQCHAGERSLQTLSDGTSALIFVGDNTTFAAWVELVDFTSADAQAEVLAIPSLADPALYVQIVGPSPEFSAEDALAVANSV